MNRWLHILMVIAVTEGFVTTYSAWSIRHFISSICVSPEDRFQPTTRRRRRGYISSLPNDKEEETPQKAMYDLGVPNNHHPDDPPASNWMVPESVVKPPSKLPPVAKVIAKKRSLPTQNDGAFVVPQQETKLRRMVAYVQRIYCYSFFLYPFHSHHRTAVTTKRSFCVGHYGMNSTMI